MRRCLAAIALALGLALGGCDFGAPAPPPLNSERIEQVFGSYGVEVLSSDEELRISSLYSTADGIRTTRTLAIVAWPAVIDASLAEPHAAIAAGASIGATLEAAGWTVAKHNLFIGWIDSPDRLSRLMRIPQGSLLTIHGYALAVTRGDDERLYATIAELHHPEYLDLEMIEDIYGEASPERVADAFALRILVDEGLAKLAALPSAGGE